MTVDRLLREEETLGDFRVAKPLRDEREHLELARCQVRRVLSCRGARSPRQGAGAALAQSASDDRRCRTGAEALELGQRAAQGIVVVCVSQRQGGLVGAADLGPELGGPRPLAPHLEGIRLGRVRWNLLPDPRPPAPAGELADHPRSPAPHGEVEGSLRRLCDRLVLAFEPGGLGSRGCDRRDPRKLSGRLRQRERLVERRPDLRIAAARSDQPEHDEGEGAGRRRDAPLVEHEGCRVDRLAPAPLVELRPGTIDEQVEARQIEAVLGALLEPGLDVTVHERVRPVLKGNPGEELVGVLDVLVELCLLGELEAPLQLLATPGRPRQVLQRADADLGVAEDLGIVEALRELDRPCAPDQGSFGVLGESAKPQTRCCTPSRARVRAEAARAEPRPPGRIAPPRLLDRDTREVAESPRSASPSLRRSPSRR